MKEAVCIERGTRISRFFAAFGLLILVLLITAPFYGGRSDLYLLVEIFSYLALASLWNLLAGYTGLVSIGQQAFVGLGGYTLFALTIFFWITTALSRTGCWAGCCGARYSDGLGDSFGSGALISPLAPGWWQRYTD